MEALINVNLINTYLDYILTFFLVPKSLQGEFKTLFIIVCIYINLIYIYKNRLNINLNIKIKDLLL